MAGDGLTRDHRGREQRVTATLGLGRARLGMALFLAYTGLELAVGTWAFTILTQARGVPPMAAGSWVSLYWGALTAGRLTRVAIGTRLTEAAVLRLAVMSLTAGIGLFAFGASPAVALCGLLFAGCSAGPIFPTLIAATPSRVSGAHVANTIGLQIAAAAIGQACVPSVLGVLADGYGFGVLSVGLVVVSLLVLALNELAASPTDSTRSLTASRANAYSAPRQSVVKR